MRQITVETAFYPFVLLSFRGAPTESEYRALFETVAQISRKAIRENTKYVTVVVSGCSLSAQDRKLVASLADKQPEELASPVLGSFVIVESALARGALTALRWLSPKLAKLETPATPQEAINAAVACLKKHHVDVFSNELMGARNWINTEANRVNKGRTVRA